MLFDPHTPLINRDTNEQMQEKLDEKTSTPVTHGIIARRALDAKFQEDAGKDADVYKRFILGTRIAGAKDGETLDLTIDEAKVIKDVVAKAFHVGIWGQIWAALDAAAKGPVANGKAEGATLN